MFVCNKKPPPHSSCCLTITSFPNRPRPFCMRTVSGKSQQVADPLSRLFTEAGSSAGQWESASRPTEQAKITPQKLLSRMAHVAHDGQPVRVVPMHGRRSSIYSLPATTVDKAGKLETVANQLQQQLLAGKPLQLPRAVWSSHQQKDDRLGPIYR